DGAVAAGTVPSVSVAAVRGGGGTLGAASGWAGVGGRRPPTPGKGFRIGSVFKSGTGTGAAVGPPRGDPDIGRPPARHPPPTRRSDTGFDGVTLSALLDMHAGMIQAVHYRGLDADVLGLSADAFVDNYAIAPVRTRARFLYSNMGPELVARSLAAAVHENFAE